MNDVCDTKAYGYNIKNNIPEFAVRVGTVHGVVAAVGEGVVAQIALAGGGVAVGVDEPADGGVIIAALEVVEAGFIVLIVAAIPQGVDLRHSADGRQHLAVGVVGILCHLVAVAVHQVHYITLQVRDVIIGGSGGTVVVDQGIGEADIVIPEIQGFGCAVASNGLPQQLPAGVDVAVLLRFA